MNVDGSKVHLDVLIARARGGDESAFEALLRQHAGHLESYVRRQLPAELTRTTDASDVVQDTLLEACQRFAHFEATDESSLRRWLCTIARRRLVDLLREHRTAKRGGNVRMEYPDQVIDELVPMLQDLAVYYRTPSRSAMSHERRVALQGAVDGLRPLYRDVIRRRYFDGSTVTTVAASLGRGERAVQMLCTRALKQLRRQLEASPGLWR